MNSFTENFIVVTDNQMSAKSAYPHHKNFVFNIAGVLGLQDGTAVKIHEVRVGKKTDGPCHVARLLIKRGVLVDAEECDDARYI